MKTLLLIILLSINSFGALYRVAQNKAAYGAQFDKIQDAVDACISGNDVVIVMDNAVYKEMVTFQNKKGIKLISQAYIDYQNVVHNKSILPTIKYTDLTHIYPLIPQDFRPQDFGLTTEQKNDFQSNGVVRFLKSENCSLEGFNIDGDDGQRGQLINSYKAGNREMGPCGVGWITDKGIWNSSAYPIYTGTSGISVNNSRLITIRGCNIYNNFYGIDEYGRDPQGIYAREEGNSVPLSKYGASGNNLYEKNHIFDNNYGIIVEFSWGLGTTFRHNLVYDNYLRTNLSLFTEGGFNGGVFRISDAFEPQWKVYNNTFYNNKLIINKGWRAGVNWLFSNNFVSRPSIIGDNGKDLIAKYTNIYHNLFEIQQTNVKPGYIKNASIDNVWRTLTQPYSIMFYSAALFYDWDLSKGGSTQVHYVNDSGDTAAANYTVNGVLPDSKIVTSNSVDISSQDNYWITTLLVNSSDSTYYRHPFMSTDRNDKYFLMPNYNDSLHPLREFVRDKSRLEDGVIDRDFTNGDIGALCILQNGGSIDWTGQFEGAKLKILDGTFAQINTNTGDTKINFSLEITNGTNTDYIDSTIEFASILYYNDMPDLNNGLTQIPSPITVDVSTLTKPRIGGNTINITGIPTPGTNALFQIVIKGKNKIGKEVYSNIGIFPFRNNIVTSSNTYSIGYFNVDFYKNGVKINKAEVGEEITLKVSLSGFSVVDNVINLITQSGDNLLYNDTTITKWPIPFSESGEIKVKFNKTGIQILNVSGNDDKTVAIGSSSPIEITSAAPNYAQFYDPPSSKSNTNILTSVPAHSTQRCIVKVYDRFGNLSTNTGGTDTVKISIDSTNYFKLSDPTDQFVVRDDGTVKFNAECLADYTNGSAKKANVTVKLLHADGTSDYTTLIVGPPQERLYAIAKKDTTYISDIVEVHLLVSKDGKNATPGVNTTFTILSSSAGDVQFYWDASGSNSISKDVAYSFTEDTIIYVSKPTSGLSSYQIKEGTGRRTSIDKIWFIEPPIVDMFITWSNDSTDEANTPIAIPISDGSFKLYAWGKDEQGNIIPIAIDWKGTGVFDGLNAKGASVEINLDPTMIGTGTFKGTYTSKSLSTETANITILDKVDEIYLIKGKDYQDSMSKAELKALNLTKDSIITINLGDSVSLYSIGIDTTKGTVFKLRLKWNINNANGFKFRIDSSNVDNFTRTFNINEIKAVGNANVKIQYTPADTINKPILRQYCTINIVDPVNNILLKTPDNVSDDQTNILLSGINNGDTVSVDENAITLNNKRLGISSFWQKGNNSLVPLAVDWKITSMKLLSKNYNYPKDSSVTSVDLVVLDLDLIKVETTRNGIDFSFYVNILDLIKIGIYPNPVPVVRFSGSKKPTIRLITEGTVKDIRLMIYDNYGNVVKILQGIGTRGDFSKDLNASIQGTTGLLSDSTASKAETYICRKWNGKNIDGNFVSSGRYIMNFKYTYVDKYKKTQIIVEKVPFYIIGKKE